VSWCSPYNDEPSSLPPSTTTTAPPQSCQSTINTTKSSSRALIIPAHDLTMGELGKRKRLAWGRRRALITTDQFQHRRLVPSFLKQIGFSRLNITHQASQAMTLSSMFPTFAARICSDAEIGVAHFGHCLLNLPITVDKSKAGISVFLRLLRSYKPFCYLHYFVFCYFSLVFYLHVSFSRLFVSHTWLLLRFRLLSSSASNLTICIHVWEGIIDDRGWCVSDDQFDLGNREEERQRRKPANHFLVLRRSFRSGDAAEELLRKNRSLRCNGFMRAEAPIQKGPNYESSHQCNTSTPVWEMTNFPSICTSQHINFPIIFGYKVYRLAFHIFASVIHFSSMQILTCPIVEERVYNLTVCLFCSGLSNIPGVVSIAALWLSEATVGTLDHIQKEGWHWTGTLVRYGLDSGWIDAQISTSIQRRYLLHIYIIIFKMEFTYNIYSRTIKAAVEFIDSSSTPCSRNIPDPLGFTRVPDDQDDSTLSHQKKDAKANRKSKKAWEVVQALFKNLMVMGFMMWTAGSKVHLFSIGIMFSALWQLLSALQGVGKVFAPYKDSKVDLLTLKLLFIALNLGG
ncbi:hypothetical protein M8C21_012160, partial [Ambrosia artemisiifolia]